MIRRARTRTSCGNRASRWSSDRGEARTGASLFFAQNYRKNGTPGNAEGTRGHVRERGFYARERVLTSGHVRPHAGTGAERVQPLQERRTRDRVQAVKVGRTENTLSGRLFFTAGRRPVPAPALLLRTKGLSGRPFGTLRATRTRCGPEMASARVERARTGGEPDGL